MDMDSMTMAPSVTATGVAEATSSSLMASNTAMPATGMELSCKISMLWNWNTVGTCFLARSWHVRSKEMFAGTCIGAILLVMALEFLRRLSAEYNRFIIRKYQKSQPYISIPGLPHGKSPCRGTDNQPSKLSSTLETSTEVSVKPFRPSIFQQTIRASLHTLQVTVAYFVMLLAMSYNGYVIISILLGAWLGGFIFSWNAMNTSGQQEEATMCCG